MDRLGSARSRGRQVGAKDCRQAAWLDHTRFQHPPQEWTTALPVSELAERALTPAKAGDAEVLLYRDGSKICAISDVCSHRAGPLHEGNLNAEARTVTCPWHASEFDLETGGIVRGPAVARQSAYETRVTGDQIEVKVR